MASGTIKQPGWKLLWQNTSPQATFGPQSIPVDGSYRLYCIIAHTDASATQTVEAIAPNGKAVLLNFYHGYNKNGASRDVSWVNGGGFHFDNCYYGSTSANNAILIPYQIWGIP